MNVPLFNELDIGKARNAQMSGLGGEAEIFRSIAALLV
jgi:hypothetical protein